MPNFRKSFAAAFLLSLFSLFAFSSIALKADAPAEKALAFENAQSNNKIDKIVLERLKELNLPPSKPCSDEVFIRRVYIDAIGCIPTVQEAKDFFADKSSDKREKLIDNLLEREEFASYAAMRWSDLLRIKAEFPSNLWPNAAQLYHNWVKASIAANVPYDRFAREILTSSGSNFHAAPVNFFRAFQNRSPRLIADNVALVFLGLRLDNSGFSEERLQGFSAFFAKVAYKNTGEWKEEIVYFNPEGKLLDPKTKALVQPAALDGKPVSIASGEDPRLALANWLASSKNPWFAKCAVNRAWFWLLGSGIVNEPDDMRSSNPPWSPKLLSYLADELADNDFDMRHIYRLILNSATYQRSSTPNQWNASDDSGFSHYRLRRIDAEPLIDIICAITNSNESYSSGIPEPFTFLPSDMNAVEIADGSISSPFLDLFGRPARNSAFASERNSSPSILQAQHMLNSSHIQRKIDKPDPVIRQLQAEKKGKNAVIEELYLRILSRYPTASEKSVIEAYYFGGKRKPGEALNDIAWAILNSKEFILKH